MTTPPSLDDFAESDAAASRPGIRAKIDALPEDIQAQILASRAGHATVARWLKSQGHPITEGMVLHWRQNRGWQRD